MFENPIEKIGDQHFLKVKTTFFVRGGPFLSVLLLSLSVVTCKRCACRLFSYTPNNL